MTATDCAASKRKLDDNEMMTVLTNITSDFDLLAFYWYIMFGDDWTRGLMMSDCRFMIENINHVVVLRDCLNDHSLDTSDLYGAYHGHLGTVSDAKYVFDQICQSADRRLTLNSERFFCFNSFAARCLFVLCKLDLLRYYDGTPIPRQFASWRQIVLSQMGRYLVNVLRLNEHEVNWVNMKLLNPAPNVQITYNVTLRHSIEWFPNQVPIVLDPNSFSQQCPRIQIDMRHSRAVNELNVFRNRWSSPHRFEGREELQKLADALWPRVDRPNGARLMANGQGSNQHFKAGSVNAMGWPMNNGHGQWRPNERSERVRVCPIWARGGHCKWGQECYDLHHGITAYPVDRGPAVSNLEENKQSEQEIRGFVDQIIRETTASPECPEYNLTATALVQQTDDGPALYDEGSESMKSNDKLPDGDGPAK